MQISKYINYNKTISLLCLSLVIYKSAYSAQENHVWLQSSKSLNILNIQLSPKNILQTSPVLKHQQYNLKPISTIALSNQNHVRFALTYQDLPIWGKQIILHYKPNKTLISGSIISGIEKDIPNMAPILTEEQATVAIIQNEINPIKLQQTQKIIYLDKQHNAHLAYLFEYFTQNNQAISNPLYIIDANTGKILEHYDNAKYIEGFGPGGNATNLPYRSGSFQYGNKDTNLPSLGTFSLTKAYYTCYTETPASRVINLENSLVSMKEIMRMFPMLDYEENTKNISSMSNFCWPWSSQYENTNDNGYAPVNGGYSPVNDALYFVQATLDMYKNIGIDNPLGTEDLPIRVYTHIGGFDNAFAIPTIYSSSADHKIIAHQQIVLSNGESFFTTTTQSIIAHELTHNFTAMHSKLAYTKQSGGINESFSDMAAIAMIDYVSQKYPFYWDHQDWSLGRESTISGEPLRYMDHPAQDGYSIEHVDQYKDTKNVHSTSGVFNKAFYLLATTEDWSIQKAFQVMVDANINYWESHSTFNQAACGVIEASKDRGYDETAVINAFKQVGVQCDS